MKSIGIAFLIHAAASASALVASRKPLAFASDRRAFFRILRKGAAVAVVASSPAPPARAAGSVKTGPANPLTGDYDDPEHPGCLRQVKVVGAPQKADGSRPLYAVVEVTGYDGKNEKKTCDDRPNRDDLWKVVGKTRGNNEALLDFSGKGGPSDLVGKWDGSGIVFPDGNKWTKLSYAPKDRRPKDMSTLTDGPL